MGNVTKTSIINVRDIHCESCENTIRAALGNCEGIVRVSASADTNQVRVSFVDTAISEEKIRARLSEIGYEPEAN